MKARRWTFASLQAAYELHARSAASSLELYRQSAVPVMLKRAQAHARAWWRLSDVYVAAVLHPETHPEILP